MACFHIFLDISCPRLCFFPFYIVRSILLFYSAQSNCCSFSAVIMKGLYVVSIDIDSRELSSIYKIRFRDLAYHLEHNCNVSHADAEDVAADTLLYVWRIPCKCDAVKFNDMAWKYILKCAKHRLLDKIDRENAKKRDVKKTFSIDEENHETISSGEPLPDQQLIQEEKSEKLNHIIKQLPRSYQEIIHMYYSKGCSTMEIADHLALSVRSATRYIDRARDMLRDLIQKSDYDFR